MIKKYFLTSSFEKYGSGKRINKAIIFVLICFVLANLFVGSIPTVKAYVTYPGNSRWIGYDLPVVVNLDGITRSLGSITPDQIKTETRNAMNTWNSVGNSFYFIEGRGANVREEVRIVTGTPSQYPPLAGAVAITGFMDDSFNCGGPATYPLRGACIIINENVNFKTVCQPAIDSHDLQTTLLHELGHALGLQHTQDYHPEAIMWSNLDLIGQFLGCRHELAQDDINGLISLYGLISPLANASTQSLISPVNGATLSQSQTSFDWSDSSNADGYYIQISRTNDFLNLVYKNNPTNSFISSVPGLTSESTYFWRVKANGSGSTGNSIWSEVRSFTIQGESTNNVDHALFTGYETLPDGYIAVPNERLVKTWRIRNTGTSTWNSGYKLAFVSGNQMEALSSVNLPNNVAPNQTVDISVNITAPTKEGTYQGNWRMRNPNGTYFGDTIWVNIRIGTSSSNITLTADPPSPASAEQIRIYARVNNFPNLRALRIFIDGKQLCELGAPEIKDCVWHTSGYATGQHSISAEADDWTGSPWDNPERRIITYELTGGGIVNHAPYRPTLVANPAYDWYVTIGNAPRLCAQANGDPDGDAINQYRFIASASVGTADSGWVGSSCYTFGSITPGTYEWHAQARDNRGGVSDWSDSWHFTVSPAGITAYIDHFSPASPSNTEEVKIYGCTSGHSGVNITMRVLVNDSNDGSDSGQWHIIKEQGSSCFNDVDVPIWRTLEYSDGPHRVRIAAWAIQPDAGDYHDEIYTLNHRRPDSPHLVSPVPASQNIAEPVYLNSRTITFKWSPTIRAQNYTLYVSTSPSPKDDPSPILRQTFDSSVNEYTLTFGQDYPVLYWQVEATNDVGSDASGAQLFGVDEQPPSCSVQSLAPKTYESVFQVVWGGTDNLAGVQTFDVQYKDSDRGKWEDWLTGIASIKTYELFTGQPGHTYYFRCRSTDNANNPGSYPESEDIYTTIDPASRPPTPWWDSAYSGKRNITILNNMVSATLPAGYPVHVHFDGTTSPTAAELYAASQSSPKCNDLRVVYNDNLELDHIVQNCNGDAIDFWFRSQVDILGGASNNTAHQLYYGNASAGAPLADPNHVWYPYRESDTTYLYFLQEGSGSTAYDFSGNARNCSINSSVQWATSKFGNGLRFNRADYGDSRSLNCGSAIPHSAFTIEFWYKPDPDDGGRIAGELAGGGNGGGGNNWLLQLFEGRILLDVWPCPTCGSSDVRSNSSLLDPQYLGKWSHIAVTFNGGNEVRFYINGALDATKYLSQSGINQYSPPLEIGSVEGIGQLKANLGAFRISNGVKTSFGYGAYANITNEPVTAVGVVIDPPVMGSPDLSILSLSTYPNPDGGVLVEAVVQNQGNRDTQDGFYTDLYLNHLPTGAGDYTGSLQFWVNDPILAGGIVTLTTVVTDLSALSGGMSMMSALSPGQETSGTLYAQTDSMGVLNEPDKQNNISASGVPICIASPDVFESDDPFSGASVITLGQPQSHNFAQAGDNDWVKFVAVAGTQYFVQTTRLGSAADTYLYLYDTDGTTILASNDDYEEALSSRIVWTAPASGTYFVSVRGWNPNTTGCGTAYTLSVVPYMQGDANADGIVDGIDYVIWLNHYGTSTTNGSEDGDYNADGVVDGIDYVLWLNHYGARVGQTQGSPASSSLVTVSPEPVSLYLEPTAASISTKTNLKLMLDAKSNSIAFAHVELTFNPAILMLSDEITPTPTLGTVVTITGKEEANATGEIKIIIALPHGESAPTGSFILAQIPVSLVSPGQKADLTITNDKTAIIDLTPVKLVLRIQGQSQIFLPILRK